MKNILYDKTKENNLSSDYINIELIKTVLFSNFIPSIINKRLTLLIFDLIYGEMDFESGKDVIIKYHIPYVFIEFNLLIF